MPENDGGITADNAPFADTDALPVVGLSSDENSRIPKRRVFSWALWDWATQPMASVITTFVFTVYVTSSLFLPEETKGARRKQCRVGFGPLDSLPRPRFCLSGSRHLGRPLRARFWPTL
jgi:hypothetical protein